MAAGGPGDHPLTDVLFWKIPTYGEIADGELHKLAKLLSERELYEWWDSEIDWQATPETASVLIHNKLQWAIDRGMKNGWEVS